MSTCDESRLFLYAEKLCSDEERREIEEHLGVCRQCQIELEELNYAVGAFTKFYEISGNQTCPCGEDLVSYSQGAAEMAQVNLIKDHVATCLRCKEDLRILGEFGNEAPGLLDPCEVPQLSKQVLEGLKGLESESLRSRMEKVFKSLIATGGEAITSEKITQLLDRYFSKIPDLLPTYAIPSDATSADTELELRKVPFLTDATFEIGIYKVVVKAETENIEIKVRKGEVSVPNIEIEVQTQSSGTFKGVTDGNGICVLDGVPDEPCSLKIRILSTVS